jgi:Lon protease-like protein
METIPIFPLDLILYPNQVMPLRIFEPRYRQMLDNCMSGNRKFGICKTNNEVQETGWDGPVDIGTIAYILKCEDLDLTGTSYYIELMGKERFEIKKLIQPSLPKPLSYNPPEKPSMQAMLNETSGKPLYFQAEIEYLPELEGSIDGNKWKLIIGKLEKRIKEAAAKMGIEFKDFTGFIEHNKLGENNGSVQDFYNISSMCGLTLEMQQSILEAKTINQAIDFLDFDL